MKKYIGLALFLFCAWMGNAQILEPVKWTTSVNKISETEYELVAKASIDAGWHLYSQTVPKEGPVATSFAFDTTDESFNIIGDTSEDDGHTVYDPVFEMEIKFFEDKAVFRQQVTTEGDLSTINAIVEYMVCDDTRCLPPAEEELVFDLNGQQTSGTTASDQVPGNALPDTDDETVVNKGTEDLKGLWSIFFIAFISGFAALLTPCVFPMIPMTVSFFTKQSKNRAQGVKNAVFYGISIVLIYVVLGSLVTAV
ncbi:hypothetical protein GO009_15805, partial [Muricauda sp. TY007]|uniref:protein-disulfide reductase DsbD domain-containing protein n=1 Tax=Allomuricauda sp. TY007 TaxID=2683200 RepID=UPI0013C0334F